MVSIKMEMASLSLWETVPCICEVAHFESVFSSNGYQHISWRVLSNVDHTHLMVMLYSHGSLAHRSDEQIPNRMWKIVRFTE